MTLPFSFRPGLLNAVLIAVGLSGSALVLLKQMWPSLLGSLCLIGWTFGEVLRILWEEFKEDPEEAFVALLGLHILRRMFLRTYHAHLVCQQANHSLY